MSFAEQKILQLSLKYPDLDFSKSVYGGCRVLMTAHCPKHGPVTKTPAHWNVNGCPECGYDRMRNPSEESKERKYSGFRLFTSNKNKKVLEQFEEWKVGISPLYEVLVGYVSERVKIKLRCVKHNVVFETSYKTAKKGQFGCPACVSAKLSETKKLTAEQGILRCRVAHGDLYDYTNTDFSGGRHSTVVIKCRKHGAFKQSLHNHINGTGCPSCRNVVSKPENEIRDFLVSLGLVVEQRNRSIIQPKELDLYVPSLGVAVELNGLNWHADDKGGTSIRQKYDLAKAEGVQVINIFADEWFYRRHVLESMLRRKLTKSEDVFYARKCTTRLVTAAEARVFLEATHVQGFVGGNHYALFSDETLVCLLTSGKSRYEPNCYEILRFSSSVKVVGGFAKLFSKFVKEENPTKVVSYADLRFGYGTVYKHAGFSLEKRTDPDYWWFNRNERLSRYETQKHKLKSDARFSDHCSEDKTETEICVSAGYRRISGVGHNKWVWQR